MKFLHLLRLWYWQYRLHIAQQYRHGMERVMQRDIAAAQHDLETCEVMLARTRAEMVTYRADVAMRVRKVSL